MKLLLDTHAFLWAVSAPEKLPNNVRDSIESRSNQAFVSAVSFWEIAIKVRLGKLDLDWDDDLVEAAVAAGFIPTELTPDEAASSSKLLEETHTDPFDRMLAWQAICRGLTLVSADSALRRFKPFGLKMLWQQSKNF